MFRATWNLLSCPLGLDECLDHFIDLAFLETNADLLTCFIVRYAYCRHDIRKTPEIAFKKVDSFFFEILVFVARGFPFNVPAVSGFLKDLDGGLVVFG
jgi:hypothetical protein